jgi:hypothetical protein
MTRSDWGGKDGELYPVQPGDIWKVGQHLLACGDLERGDALKLLDLVGPPDVTHTDPPWNAGIASAFRTQAADPKKVDFTALMRTLAEALKRTTRDVVIEMGIAQTPHVCSIMQAAGAKVHGIWAATYGAKKLELRVIHLTFTDVTPAAIPHTLLHSWAAASSTMDAICKPGDLVFDPCLGQGGTLRLAHQRGASVIGMELNPKRLSTAIAWAAQYDTPERVGTL